MTEKAGRPQSLPAPHPLRVDPASRAALRLWVILNRASSAITAHAAADVARHGLTLAEFGAMEALYHLGPMPLGELQQKILVSSGGITFLVDRLSLKGLVERRARQEDRRSRLVALTGPGEQLIERIFPEHAERLKTLTQGLSREEQRTVTELLKQLGLAAAAIPPERPFEKP